MGEFNESAARNEWDRNAELRAEFDYDYDSYLAFKRAEFEGKFRVAGGVYIPV